MRYTLLSSPHTIFFQIGISLPPLLGEGKTPKFAAHSNIVPDNRRKEYNGINYYHDELHDQLIKAEILKKDGTKETWLYLTMS